MKSALYTRQNRDVLVQAVEEEDFKDTKVLKFRYNVRANPSLAFQTIMPTSASSLQFWIICTTFPSSDVPFELALHALHALVETDDFDPNAVIEDRSLAEQLVSFAGKSLIDEKEQTEVTRLLEAMKKKGLKPWQARALETPSEDDESFERERAVQKGMGLWQATGQQGLDQVAGWLLADEAWKKQLDWSDLLYVVLGQDEDTGCSCFLDRTAGHPDMAYALLQAGMPINERDPLGRTLLFYARDPELIEYLAQNGADPSLADDDELTAYSHLFEAKEEPIQELEQAFFKNSLAVPSPSHAFWIFCESPPERWQNIWPDFEKMANWSWPHVRFEDAPLRASDVLAVRMLFEKDEHVQKTIIKTLASFAQLGQDPFISLVLLDKGTDVEKEQQRKVLAQTSELCIAQAMTRHLQTLQVLTEVQYARTGWATDAVNVPSSWMETFDAPVCRSLYRGCWDYMKDCEKGWRANSVEELPLVLTSPCDVFTYESNGQTTQRNLDQDLDRARPDLKRIEELPVDLQVWALGMYLATWDGLEEMLPAPTQAYMKQKLLPLLAQKLQASGLKHLPGGLTQACSKASVMELTSLLRQQAAHIEQSKGRSERAPRKRMH